jgi:hypothetical protein
MSEWDQRQLCPDGGCVGVIGADGTCKVCGRAAPNWGDERNRGLNPAADEEQDAGDEEDDELEEGDEDEGGEDEGDEDESDEDESGEAASPAWEERKLCPDDACIGVIGEDGTCKVCGRSAA